MPVVMFVGSCKILISARSDLVIANGDSIAGGPRSTLKIGGGGMSIGEDGNGTSVAGSLLLFPFLASGDAVLLVSCELRMMASGSWAPCRLEALLPLLRKTLDMLPCLDLRERRLRLWRRDATADFGAVTPSWTGCLLGVVHRAYETLESLGLVTDELLLASATVARRSCSLNDIHTCYHDFLSETPLRPLLTRHFGVPHS